jgi:hypothetical protein
MLTSIIKDSFNSYGFSVNSIVSFDPIINSSAAIRTQDILKLLLASRYRKARGEWFMKTFFGDYLPVDTFDSTKNTYMYCGSEQNSIIFAGDAGKFILFYRSLLYSYDYVSAILLDVANDIAYVSILLSDYDWCIKRISNPMMDFLISKKFLSKEFRLSYCTDDAYRRNTSLIYFPQPVQLGHYITNCLSPMARVSSLFKNCSSSTVVSTSPSNFLSTSFLNDLAESYSSSDPLFHVFPNRTEALLYASRNQLSPCEIHGLELNHSLSSKINEVLSKKMNSSNQINKLDDQPKERFKIIFGIRSKTRVLINLIEFISLTIDMISQLIPGPLHVVIDGMCSTHTIGAEGVNENSIHYSSIAEEINISDIIAREISQKGISCESTIGKPLDDQLYMLYNSNIAICPQGAATVKYIGLLGIPTFSHGPLNLDKQFNALAGSNFKESGFIMSSMFIEPEYPVPEQVAPSNAISLKENPQQKMEWDVGKSDTRSNYSINIDVCHVALRDFLKSLPSRRVDRHQ